MKNLLKVLSLLLVCSNIAFSQSTIGVRGGVTLSTVNDNSSDDLLYDLEKNNLSGVDVALFSTINVYDFISVQPEVHWMQKGVKYTNTTSNDMDVKMKMKYNYIEVPILARVDFGTKVLGIYVVAGPSVGYGIAGKFIGENILLGGEAPVEGDYEEDLEWVTEFDADGVKDNRWDVSGVAGLGLDIDLGAATIVVDARSNLDFNDRFSYETTPSPEPDKIFNRGMAFTAGIAIPIGR